MPDLTIQDQCGASATLSNGVLSITLSEVGLDDASPSSSQIIGALILRRHQLQQSTTAAEDATVGVVVDAPFLGFARNDSQIIASFSVGLYRIAPAIAITDPDEIVT